MPISTCWSQLTNLRKPVSKLTTALSLATRSLLTKAWTFLPLGQPNSWVRKRILMRSAIATYHSSLQIMTLAGLWRSNSAVSTSICANKTDTDPAHKKKNQSTGMNTNRIDMSSWSKMKINRVIRCTSKTCRGPRAITTPLQRLHLTSQKRSVKSPLTLISLLSLTTIQWIFPTTKDPEPRLSNHQSQTKRRKWRSNMRNWRSRRRCRLDPFIRQKISRG